MNSLVETFNKCQERLEKKLKEVKEVVKELHKNMIKTLKFRKNLRELILKNEKNTTWRIFDDKDIREGDVIQFLVWETKEAFAKAKIINVVEKKFKDLDEYVTKFVMNKKIKDEIKLYQRFKRQF